MSDSLKALDVEAAERQKAMELARRQFITAMFSILKALQIHDSKNDAVQKPIQMLRKSFDELKGFYGDVDAIEMRYQDGLLILMGQRMNSHFSIVESLKFVVEAFERALIENLKLKLEVTNHGLSEFFSQLASHISLGYRSKTFSARVSGVEWQPLDPHRVGVRGKNRQLLLSPQYALQHYYILRRETEQFFVAIQNNQVPSQKKIRRQLMELAEVFQVSSYQGVALALLRHRGEDLNGLHSAVSQAVATGLLSMAVAKELHFPLADQINLGLIGILYNIGLLGEESATILKNDRLSSTEYKRVLDAQATGVTKLLQMQGASRPVLERLLAIFEQGRKETSSVSLTLEARLLRLVSQYVALTSERPFRDAYTPHEAVRILGSKVAMGKNAELDPLLYYVFVRLIGVCPMGSLVLLSNQETAVVFRPSGEKVQVPLVKVVPKGDKERAKMLDLSEPGGVEIVKVLDPRREGVAIAGYFFD